MGLNSVFSGISGIRTLASVALMQLPSFSSQKLLTMKFSLGSTEIQIAAKQSAVCACGLRLRIAPEIGKPGTS